MTDLDIIGLLADTEIKVQKVIDCNTFNLHKVIVGVRK